MGIIGGSQQNLNVQNLVYDASSLAWVAMTQPLVKTDTLAVTSTTDLTKIGGTAVGATNGLYVRPGTSSLWDITMHQHSVTDTLTGAEDEVLLQTGEAMGSCVFQVSGTWKGKIVVEGAVDSVYNNLSIVQPSGTITFTGVNNDNQNGIYRVLMIAGYTKIRLRMSAYTSGTASVIINTAPVIPTAYSWQLNAANLQVTANQSTASNLKVDLSGTAANSTAIKVDGSAVTQPVSGTVTSTVADGLGIKIYDVGSSTYKGLQFNDKAPQVCAQDYLQALAEGDISGHTTFEKIGYTALTGTTTKDVWSYTDNTITIPTGPTAMEVYTANANDAGTVLHSGVTTTAGSTTTLEKTGENFLTTTAVGDLVIVDAAGTSPAYGFITAVDSDTKVTFAGGLSDGGSGASRATYSIVDVSATTGAHAVQVKYLTTAFAEKKEIVILGGLNTGVDLVNTDTVYIQSFRVISCGSTGASVAAIQLWDADGTAPVYTYITAGYTRARNSLYTVPAGKTLYVVSANVGYATTSNQIQSARIILKAMQNDGFNGNSFQAFGEVVAQSGTVPITFPMPIKVVAGVTLKITAVPTANGYAVTSLRGWLE